MLEKWDAEGGKQVSRSGPASFCAPIVFKCFWLCCSPAIAVCALCTTSDQDAAALRLHETGAASKAVVEAERAVFVRDWVRFLL
eukprot:2469211-Rhodomonas_salina.5